MPLDVLAGPGCAGLKGGTIKKLARGRADFAVVDVTEIYRGLGGTSASPSDDPRLLGMAQYLAKTAVRFAREKGIDGVVVTSNGSRAKLDELVEQAGGRLLVADRGRAEVCRRLRQFLPNDATRVQVCEAGLDRWFRRYQPAPGDVQL